MLILSMNRYTHRAEGRPLFRKRLWLRILVLSGLGGMVVMLLCLLSGCGSDSKPEAMSGKKEKTATSPKAMKSRAAPPLMNLGEISRGTVKKGQLNPDTELAPGLTVREVEKRMEATRKRVEAPDYEVVPGITKQKLDDKIAAEQKRHESDSKEILPGITRQELDARMAAHLKRAGSSNEGLSGITKEELNARLEAERMKRESPHEVVPGVTKDELDAKLRQAEKQ